MFIMLEHHMMFIQAILSVYCPLSTILLYVDLPDRSVLPLTLYKIRKPLKH